MEHQTLNPKKYDLPFWLIMAYLFFEFGRPQDWIPFLGSLRLGMVIQILCFLSLVTRLPKRFPKQAVLILIFLMVMAKSVPFALNNYLAFKNTEGLAFMLFGSILPMIVFINSYSKLNFMIRFFILVNIFVAVNGLTHGRGIGAFTGDENDFALLMNMSIPLSFYLFFGEKSKKWKVLLGTSIVIFMLGDVASKSRGGFLGLIAVSAYSWWGSKKKLKATVLVFLVIVCMFSFAPKSYWDRIKTITSYSEKGSTGEERLYLWKMAWRMFLDNPIMGVGPGNFPVVAGIKADQYMTPEEREERLGLWGGGHYWGIACHSLYFTILSETALPGAIVFLLMIYTFFKDMGQISKDYTKKRSQYPIPYSGELKGIYYFALALKGSMIGFLSTGALLSVIYYPFFWTLITMSVTIKNVFEKTILEISLEKTVAEEGEGGAHLESCTAPAVR